MKKDGEIVDSAVIGRGAYYPTKAAGLLRLQAPATTAPDVHRWAFGYARRRKHFPGAIRLDPVSTKTGTISFLELIELAHVAAMLQSGLTWPKVREAMRVAARVFPNERHPFAHRDWFADPAGAYTRLAKENGERLLVEMAGDAQYAMEGLLSIYLHQIQFNPQTGLASAWAPLGSNRPVLLDPQRSFGLPIVASGARTDILARHYKGGDRITEIAAWYQIPETEVEAAIEFEEKVQPLAA